MIGKILENYEIKSRLGKGGMGEVYEAEDQKLGRRVAIKVLPEQFANDAERVARFQREAKLLASLSHPNIAAIYGLEASEGTHFIVLEYVEGETLADRIKAGPVPIEEALHLASQIAEALEAAHEKGVIHRDLKPANVMITAGDRVKILDFGLAKALGEDTQSIDSSQSPTLTEAMTRPGIILGTAGYMSPEQAKGKPVDKRTDIWALGCILYECISGKRAFEGESVTETLAGILRGEPDWQALPPAAPPTIRFLLRRCLEKDMNRRFHDAADVRIEIEAARAEPIGLPAVSPGIRVTPRMALLLAGIVLVLGAAIAALAIRYLRAPVRPTPAHLSISLPPGDIVARVNLPLAFSPDGSRLAYVSYRSGGVGQLVLRALDNPEPKLIPGTDGASAPFFSPDGQWIAFFAQGKLKKVSIAGGAALAICAAGTNAGASWGGDDTIVFAPSVSSGLFRVPAGGGNAEVLTTLNPSKGEISHRYPQFLPGGKALVFTVMTGMGYDDQHIDLQMLDTGERRTLVRGGHTGRVVPTGHLVYHRAGSLLAVPFDLVRHKVTGSTAATIIEGMRQSDTIGGEYSFSDAGSLAYIPSGMHTYEGRLAWIDRSGKLELLDAPLRNYDLPVLSPDGRQIVVGISTSTTDQWVYDLKRGSLARLTSEGSSQYPVWTPDGRRVAYRATRGGFRNIFWRAADGTGAEERLTAGQNQQTPASWTPDGKILAFWEASPETGSDIWVLDLESPASEATSSTGKIRLRPFLQTPFMDGDPVFSPDGHWLAYHSDKSGRLEVYVQPFPGPGREWQVSTDGGSDACWAPDGHELFYHKAGKTIMAVDIRTKPAFAMGKPKLLFEYEGEVFGVTPDGRRFLAIQRVEPAMPVTRIDVVLNWFEELKRKAASGK